jgi:hypothetical protein
MALDVPVFRTMKTLYRYVQVLLTENKSIHDHFGPSSAVAKANPLSNLKELWQARKIEQVIPNNSLIVAAFKRNYELVPVPDLDVFGRFEAHAYTFAASAKERRDSAPLFPGEFARMIAREVQ